MPANYCELIQSKNFAEQLDKYLEKYERMKDVHASIDWTLGRNPTIGMSLTKPGYYVFETFSVGSTANFLVLYKYDPTEQKIYLLSLTDVHKED